MTANNLHFYGLLTNLVNKPIEHTTIPITATAEPNVVQSAFLYMNEDGGPKRLLL